MSHRPMYGNEIPQYVGENGEVAELQDGEEDEAMEEAMDDQGYASSTPTSSSTWISWFCSLPGHEYFCEVTEDFIEDDFNLTGLNSLVPFWKEAMEIVLDVEPEDALKIPDMAIVESSAELLYGLVHQRYILTRPGLQAMIEKYENGSFGACPRVYCQSCHVAPCGRSDLPGMDTVKLYCPNCNDIYTPPSSRYQSVDGAFFGTTFAPLLFQSFRELAPAPFCPPIPQQLIDAHAEAMRAQALAQAEARAVAQSASSSLYAEYERNNPGAHLPPPQSATGVSRSGATTPDYTLAEAAAQAFENPHPHGGKKRPSERVYEARLFGFRVNERARSGPRMKWLRMRPETIEELDHVDWRGAWKPGFGGDGLDGEGEFEDDFDADGEDDEEGGEGGNGNGARRGGRRRFENFDDDLPDGEQEEEEEEEEEEAAGGGAGVAGKRRAAGPRPSTFSALALMTSSASASEANSPAVQFTRRTGKGRELIAPISEPYAPDEEDEEASPSLRRSAQDDVSEEYDSESVDSASSSDALVTPDDRERSTALVVSTKKTQTVTLSLGDANTKMPLSQISSSLALVRVPSVSRLVL